MRLSVALLHGRRVDYVTGGALSKLDGVPARRSATVANGLCTPLGLVQRMGRLGGTGHMRHSVLFMSWNRHSWRPEKAADPGSQ